MRDDLDKCDLDTLHEMLKQPLFNQELLNGTFTAPPSFDESDRFSAGRFVREQLWRDHPPVAADPRFLINPID